VVVNNVLSEAEGDILIDEQSIYDVTSDSLRSQIALIPQDTMLFHRSIGENIGYAKENATQQEIEQAHHDLHNFQNGFEMARTWKSEELKKRLGSR
jgi:ABC-type multidrug transport system fused ATPase/permease subunit